METLPGSCTTQSQDEYCFGHSGIGCQSVAVLDSCGEGKQAVSVGSIAHDTCCLACKEGIACSGSAPGPLSITSLDDSQPCALEWRKAVWNSLDGRFWCEAKKEHEASNLDVLPDPARTYGVSNYWGKHVEDRSVHAIRALAHLCAPSGTALSCLDCDTCSNCNAGIGDSQFCCSGHFAHVKYQWWTGKRWGKCS